MIFLFETLLLVKNFMTHKHGIGANPCYQIYQALVLGYLSSSKMW